MMPGILNHMAVAARLPLRSSPLTWLRRGVSSNRLSLPRHFVCVHGFKVDPSGD